MTLLHVFIPLVGLIALLAQGLIKGRFETPYWLLLAMYLVTYALADPLLGLLTPEGIPVDEWLHWTTRMALGPLATLCVSPFFALARQRRNRTKSATESPSVAQYVKLASARQGGIDK